MYRALRSLNGVNVYMFDNSNSARTYGSELLLSYLYEPWSLTPYLSATYMHRELDRGPGNGGKTTATGDPRFYGRVGMRYEQAFTPTVQFHADAFMRMATSAKETDTAGAVARYPGWATANLAFGFRLGEEQNYFLNVNLNNLTNKTCTPASSSIEDRGLSAVISVGMEF